MNHPLRTLTVWYLYLTDKNKTVNDYGSVQKKNGMGEDNIQSFYDNRPYKQNEFDKVCKHQLERKPGLLESLKNQVAETEFCQHPFAWLLHLFPILEWLPMYNWREDLSQDVLSGITVAIVNIPQGMAYSILAGVPPITGIYMAFFPVMIYILMGTSRHLSMGTFSIICMMTSKAVVQYSDSQHYHVTIPTSRNGTLPTEAPIGLSPVQVASAVCLIVGIWHVILGFCKLGTLSVLMSDSMMSGFTTGTAFLVIASQVKHIFGVTLSHHPGPFFKIIWTIVDVIQNSEEINGLSLKISISVTLTLILYTELLKGRLSKILPVPLPVELITVVLGTLASSQFRLKEDYNITTVGYIPTGFPTPEVPPLWLLPNLIMDGLVIAIIAFSINISMASIIAKKMKYKIDSNQELLASGFGNIFASFFSCVPFAASLSRSLIQLQTGGKTQLASGVSCACLVVVLLYVGPFFQPLPHCVLTAIVLIAMKGMIMQLKDFVTYLRESTVEGVVWGATFLAVILLDIKFGLGVGICLSLICVIFMSQKVMISKLGRIFTTDIYVESNRYQSALEIPGIIILRILGSLNFVTQVKAMKKIHKLISKSTGVLETRTVVVDMMAVSSVDSTTVKAFLHLHKNLEAQGVKLKLVQFTEPARKVFARCNFFKEFPENCLFPTIHDAILDTLEQNKHSGSSPFKGNISAQTSLSNLSEVTTSESLNTLNSLSLNLSSRL